MAAVRQAERTAVLVIRAWRVANDGTDLRARVLRTVDASKPGREEIAVSGESGIIAAVRTWLDAFAPD
jgi:hypothetical protein